MSESVLVSIGIPIYNAEKYLEYAIQSVLNQTYINWELILVDDGSTDNSLNIAKSYNDNRISVFNDGENKGLAFRLNQLIGLANGKYFARMDSDDIMHYDRLRIQVNYLNNNSSVDVVGTYAFTMNNNNLIYGMMRINKNPSSLEDVLNNKCFIHPTIMAKTKWFQENKYNSEVIRMEDADLWSRTILKSTFFNIETPLLFYRQAGLPYLSKYLKSQNSTRFLINKHYKGFSNFKLLFKNYLKCLFFFNISIFNLQNFYFKKRFNNLSNIEILTNQKLLEISIQKIQKIN